MAFESLRIARFRNIAETELELGAGHIFLLGDNGQGKTNFLEALYVLSFGSSFRTRQERELPMHGFKEFYLKAAWSGPGQEQAGLETVSVRYSAEGGKDIRLNEKPIADRKELVAHHPSVVFCHEDMAFAAGVPEERRFFFDQCAGMLWLDYIDVLRAYRRVLRHRNAVLKMGQLDLLDSLDIQMARFGLELQRYRARLAELFGARFPEMYEKVSLLGSEIGIEYRPSWPQEADLDMIAALLASQRARDVEMRTSMSGPHRDRWVFTREGRDFSSYASTGQLRLASLLLRIVQACLYSAQASALAGVQSAGERSARYPVMLLDDVLLELDVPKRRRFFSLLPGNREGAQAVFTFLPGEPWHEYADAHTIVYRVSNGQFTREKGI